jgi:hypothetical protein
MIAKIMIRGDMPNSFVKKNGERVNERLLTCLDISSESQVPDTFEVLDPDLNPNSPSLVGQHAVLHVREFVPRQAGVRLIGRVDLVAADKGK